MVLLQTSYIQNVIAHCRELIEKQKTILLILDIDDTVLSTTAGQHLVEPQICELVKMVYDQTNALANIVFCTARPIMPEVNKITLNQLARAKLLHLGTRIRYNVLYSPHDTQNNVTKHTTLLKYLASRSLDVENTHVVVVDDCPTQVATIHTAMSRSTNYACTIWNYNATWAQTNQQWTLDENKRNDVLLIHDHATTL
jgi:hypothetical protein